MKLNRVFRGFALLLVVGFLATLFFHSVYFESTPAPASRELTRLSTTYAAVVAVKTEIRKKTDVLEQMVEINTAIVYAIGQRDKKGRMNALQSVADRFEKSPVAIVADLASQIDQTTTALDIVPKLETLNTQINEFVINDIQTIFTRGKATETEYIGYNLAWNNYFDAYNALSGQDLQDVNKLVFGYDDQVNRAAYLIVHDLNYRINTLEGVRDTLKRRRKTELRDETQKKVDSKRAEHEAQQKKDAELKKTKQNPSPDNETGKRFEEMTDDEIRKSYSHYSPAALESLKKLHVARYETLANSIPGLEKAVKHNSAQMQKYPYQKFYRQMYEQDSRSLKHKSAQLARLKRILEVVHNVKR